MRPSPTADLSAFLITLRHLIREPSVVGAEDSFFRVLRRELEELDISVERHSCCLVARGSEPESVILSAHIDRPTPAPRIRNELRSRSHFRMGRSTKNVKPLKLSNILKASLRGPRAVG